MSSLKNHFRIRCSRLCGNEIELGVRHDEGQGYARKACIHMTEIEARDIPGNKLKIGKFLSKRVNKKRSDVEFSKK